MKKKIAGRRRGKARRLCWSKILSRLITTDFHIHTNLSDCGDVAATFEAVVQGGIDARLEAIGVSDHIFFPHHTERSVIARGALPKEVDGMKIWVGCEADMEAPTRAAIDAEFASTLDYVMVAASHLYDPAVEQEFIDEPRSMAYYMLELTRGAVELGFVDVITHPLHVPACRYTLEHFVAAADESQMRDVAQTAAACGVALECNPKFVRAYPNASRRLFPLLLEEGCQLAINSDAHHPRGIGCRGPEYATEEELRALGISEECLFLIEDAAPRAVR